MASARTRRIWVGPFVIVVAVALTGASFLAGTLGVFSSNGPDLGRELRDPAHQLDATITLAKQVATAMSDHEAVIPESSEVGACPGTFATQASSIVGAFTEAGASAAFARANTELKEAGYRTATTTDPSLLHAVSRGGVVVEARELPSTGATSIEVTVTVACARTRPARRVTTTTSPTG